LKDEKNVWWRVKLLQEGKIMKKILQISILLIFFGISSACAQDVKYEVHEPKGSSMELVPFRHKLYNFEINIKYPEKWYATEEYGPRVNPSFYLTKEPIRGISDRYTVGMALTYLQAFFVQQAPPDSDLGKMAKAVLSVREWETVKTALVEGVESRGRKIISQEDLDVSGRPALKVESYSDVVRVRA
jgi:hypothetical protein